MQRPVKLTQKQAKKLLEGHEPFYRVYTIPDKQILVGVYTEEEVQKAIERYSPHMKVAVEGFQPFLYSDEFAGTIVATSHYAPEPATEA